MRQRKAFTLVEMMIVVGLIVVLIALAVTAYTKLVNSSAERGTVIALHNQQSLQAEYEQAAGLGRLGFPNDPNFPYYGGYFSQTGGASALPIGIGTKCATGLVADVGDAPNAPPPLRVPGRPDANGSVIYTLDLSNERAVFNTAAVMMYIARLPQARPILSGLPSKSFLKLNVKDPASTTGGGIEQGIKLGGNEAPVLLDGWGNPIIFVPYGGIVVNLKVGSPPLPMLKLVRSTGIYPADATTAYDGNPPPLKANDRPFWASAGPDGNFDNGDDNVYSFR